MKKWLFAVIFGSALVLGACGGGGDDGASDDTSGDTGTEESGGTEEGGTVDTAAAEAAFESSCASCHGADLSGGAGPDLTQIGSKLSADEIATIINEGQGSMPPGMATGDDVELIANWLAEQK